MISPGKMYVWTLVLHECLSRFSVSFWLRHGDHPRSDTAQLSKSSLWYDFHVGKRRWGGLFGTFRQVFLTRKQNIPTQAWKHIQEDRIYESVVFRFCQRFGNNLHYPLACWVLPHVSLVYQETFFSWNFDNSVFVRLSDVFMNPKLSKDRLPHTMVTMVMMLQAEKSFCLVDFKPLYVPRNLHP